MSYIIIPNLKVQSANALACNFVINSAPIFAATMFAHAMQRKTGIELTQVAMNYLDAELLAENSAPFYSGAYQPQQRMGAVFINKKDYAGSGFVPSQSLQPTASQHLLLTLVLETPSAGADIKLDSITAFLQRGKFAGGTITSHDELIVCETQDDVRSNCRTGFWLVARPDLLSFGPKMLEQFIYNATSRNNSWVVPLVFGYAAITDLAHRNNVRALMDTEDPTTINVPLHAFAEPLVSLGQFVSVNQYTEAALPFWKQSWPRPDVWLVEQSI